MTGNNNINKLIKSRQLSEDLVKENGKKSEKLNHRHSPDLVQTFHNEKQINSGFIER